MNLFKPFPHFATTAMHRGQNPDQWQSGPIVCPIFLATTFKQPVPGCPTRYDYSRAGNPSRTAVEENIAGVCDAKHAFTFSSGLACTDALIKMLHSGDHILCMDDVYSGTRRYLRKIADEHFNLNVSFVDFTIPDLMKKNLRANTQMVWIESPSNPLLKLADIEKLSRIAHNKNNDCIVVVDNTFATPYFQRPLYLGADVEFHSVTKFLNGHTDVTMGCAATNDELVAKHLKFVQLAVGAVPSPFDCYLVNRGMKTLHLRMKAHMESGIQVAQWLEKSPYVKQVFFPLLPSHPQYELAKKQMRGFSGMVSFNLDNKVVDPKNFLMALEVFILAESLGGYDSLAEQPSAMTHSSIPEDDRGELGILSELIRISVGLEDVKDLIDDLAQALEAAVITVDDDYDERLTM